MDPRLFRLFGAKPQAPHDDFGGGGSGGDEVHDAARGDDDADGDEGVPGDGDGDGDDGEGGDEGDDADDVTDKSAFNETVFQDMLREMALQQGDEQNQLTMLAGLQLKAVLSGFLGLVSPVTGVETNLRHTQSADERKKSLICDIFEYDSSIVRVVTDNHLNATVDSSTKKYTVDTGLYCGALIRPQCWTLDFMTPLKNIDLPKIGDSTAGYHKALLRLACRNPLAQGAIFHVKS